MSKVYEALRQKQSETSDPQGNFGLPNIEAELDLTDSVLRAAFSLDDELPQPARLPAKIPSVVSREEPKHVGSDGFRRLSIARQDTSRLVFLSDPHGLAAEQFRFFRQNLEEKFPDGAVLLITSPAPRDGKTLTSINLSTCLADSGRPTLLMEGDIRQPAVEKVLGTLSKPPGIEEALGGAIDPAQTVHFVGNLALHVSMVIHPPADPSRVVSGPGTKQYLEWARARFHWIVIDSPPVLPAVDVAHLTTLADAVLLVVRAQSTPRDLLTRAFEMLGDRLSGVVLNEATVESNPYYRHLAEYRHKPSSSRRAAASTTEKRRTDLQDQRSGA